MKTRKLDTTLAELHKLKNQIRVELNKIRPYRQHITPQKPSRSARKLYPERSHSTSLFGPPPEVQPTERSSNKKRFDLSRVLTLEELKINEKKHYEKTFKDQVKMKATTRRTNSSYLNVRPEGKKDSSLSARKQLHNTSLMGVGINDKSNQKGKPSKRIINTYHIFNFDLI